VFGAFGKRTLAGGRHFRYPAGMSLRAIHHIQLAMPEGAEARAREFFEGLLGLSEVPKPPVLAGRGGAWFEAGDVQVHLGVEAGFAPARKAHPGFLVDDLAALLARLADAGVDVRPDEDLPGFQRAYVDDPFGNRIELMQAAEG